MHKMDIQNYFDMMDSTINNLKSEINELTFKVKKARETGNWGTYKNLIMAYKEIIKLYKEIVDTICDQESDYTQHVNNNMTIGLDGTTSKFIADTVKYMSNNKDNKEENKNKNDMKIINLFDCFNDYKIDIKNNKSILTANITSLLSKKLKEGKNKKVLIDITGFRGVGKTYQLINFAKENNYIVFIPHEDLYFRDLYKYNKIYNTNSSQLKRGIRNRNCVVDEGVNINKIKDMGFNIITGYVDKNINK